MKHRVFRIMVSAFLMIASNLFSQSIEENSDTNLPEVIPPSPTAFQMTRYGDVPINESTGKISPSIQLYTYQAGRLQLPISLSYQGNGVKVDQAASWTGINWNLNAGGVITRTVRDQDDLMEHINRKFYSYEELNALNIHSNQESVIELHDFILGNSDSEVDIFSFSFPGYSGGFYLDEDLEPQLTRNDSPLKIEIGAPPVSNGITQLLNREIIITTPEGLKYFFGGLQASEASKTVYPVAGGGQTQFAQTAFYLHKIHHPLGDEIYFKYDSLDYNILIAVSESYSMETGRYEACQVEGVFGNIKVDKLNNKVQDGKFLRKITNNKNSYELILTNSSVPIANTAVSKHYTKVLDHLVVRNTNDSSEKLEEINFQYLFPRGKDSSQRFFLESVNFRNGTSYGMTYNHPEDLPFRFDYDQDHLGYFNNKGNTRHIPQVDHAAYSTIYNSLADKSPDFIYSSKGVLTELSYPTGGHTEFKYESGSLPNQLSTETKYKHFLTYRNDPTRIPTNKNPNSVTLGKPSINPLDRTQMGGSGDGEGFTVTAEKIVNQNIDIRLSNVKSSEHLDFHVIFRLRVKDLTDNTEKIHNKSYQYGSEHQTQDPYSGNVFTYDPWVFKKITLKYLHKYEISLEIIANSFQSDAMISANIDFNYKVQTNQEKEALGIRIKKITDQPNDKFSQTKTRVYKYFSPTEAVVPNYLHSSYVIICCGRTFAEIELINLTSSSINSIYSNSNNEKVYGKVQTHFSTEGVNNGYVEKKFTIRTDSSPLNYLQGLTGAYSALNIDDSTFNVFNAKENKSILNGTLTKETYYEQIGINEFRKIKQSTNYYSIDTPSALITNNLTKKLFERCYIYGTPRDISHTYFGLYNIYSNKAVLDSTTTKTFDYSKIPDLSLLDTDGDGLIDSEDPDDDNDGQPDFLDLDDNGNGVADTEEIGQQPEELETKVVYEYNQYVGLPTKITTSKSIEDFYKETHLVYPELVENGSSVFANNGYYGPLIYANAISKPINQYGYKVTPNGSELMFSKSDVFSNSFDHFEGSFNFTLLSSIKTSKGSNPFETRILYHDYDAYGNPLEVSKADGTHIVYIWGYNQTQPIAKIENATYAQVSSRVANLQTLSNADDDRTVDILNSNGTITKVGKEGDLREALRNLRINFKNSLVTTYTYDPLIGVTSVTDPRGNTVYYDYDPFNRLKHVKDKDGNILSKNEYNYKN